MDWLKEHIRPAPTPALLEQRKESRAALEDARAVLDDFRRQDQFMKKLRRGSR